MGFFWRGGRDLFIYLLNIVDVKNCGSFKSHVTSSQEVKKKKKSQVRGFQFYSTYRLTNVFTILMKIYFYFLKYSLHIGMEPWLDFLFFFWGGGGNGPPKFF